MKGSRRENVCKHLLYLLIRIILSIMHCVAVQSPCHFLCILVEFNVKEEGKGNGEEEKGEGRGEGVGEGGRKLERGEGGRERERDRQRDTNTNMGYCYSFP